jgi:hypothetical protein
MGTFSESIKEYRKQLGKGQIKEAYQGLMDYFSSLRLHLKNKYPDYFVSGDVNYGRMDFSYFSFSPASLKKHGLKVVILFIHDTFTFEIWLAGYNKNVQANYLKLFEERKWSKYTLAPSAKGVDYIVKHALAENVDFSDLDSLTQRIERGSLSFIHDMEKLVSQLIEKE